MQKEKKEIRFSTKIVVASVFATTLYVVAVFFVIMANIKAHTNVNVPDTLTTLFFAFWTVELVSLSTIERAKVRNKYQREEKTTTVNGNGDNKDEQPIKQALK